MNTRRLTAPLLVAFVVSGASTLLLSRRLEHHTARELPQLQYVAVSRPLQAGDVLSADNLQVLRWPAADAIPGAYTRMSDLRGRALLFPVDPGQPLTEKTVSAPGAGVGLAGRIPQGLRAIALKSDEVLGVAGFLQPGSHVDVLVTYRTDRSPDPRTVTVLQDSEVIAAGHQMEPDPQGKPATVDVVTLLLSPGDAERAVLASTQGSVHFVLRSGSDQTRTGGSGILLSELSGGSEAPAHSTGDTKAEAPAHAPRRTGPAEKASAPAASARQTTVETISGDNKQVLATFPVGGR